jgi:TRAP-type C4-dicarboxylate transport system permease small subunit
LGLIPIHDAEYESLNRKAWNIQRYAAMVALAVLSGLVFIFVVARYLFGVSFPDIEELNKILFVFFLYLALSIVEPADHFKVAIIDLFVPPRVARGLDLIGHFLWLGFHAAIIIGGIALVVSSARYDLLTANLDLPFAAIYAIVPLGFLLMSFPVAREIWRLMKNKDR